MTVASTALQDTSWENGRLSLSREREPGGLRILMTVDAVGGVWRYAMELARAMRPLGAEFVFVGLGPRARAHQRTEAEKLGTLVWTDEPLDWTADGEASLAGLPAMLKELVRAHDVDLVHLNMPSQACDLDLDLPVLAVSHSCLVTWWEAVRGGALPLEWQWQKAANRAGFDRADAVVAPSSSHAGLLDRCYGPIEGLTVVHNAVGGLQHDGPKEDYVFAAARWWDEGKNAAVLDAAASCTGWPVVAAGATQGPNGEAVAMAHVKCAGELAHADLLRLMRRAAIVVSPSRYEPFGLAALEGARVGAALVLSDIATYRELWNDAALFFDPDDPEDLAAAVNRLIADRALHESLAGRALVRSRRFTPERQAEAMAALYAGLVGAPFEQRVKGA